MKEQVEDVMCLHSSTILTEPKLFFRQYPDDNRQWFTANRIWKKRRGGEEKKEERKERKKSGIEKEKNGGGRGEKALNGTINICRCNVKSATKCRGSVNVKYTRVYRIIRGGGDRWCARSSSESNTRRVLHKSRPRRRNSLLKLYGRGI